MAKLSESISTVRYEYEDFTDQNPDGLGFSNAHVITWGAGGTTGEGEVEVGSDGVVTLLSNIYEYVLTAELRVARTTSAGRAEIIIWYEASTDGGSTWVPQGTSIDVVMPSAEVASRDIGVVVVPIGTATNTKFRALVGREDGSNNSGGLLPKLQTGTFATVNDTPSARLIIERKEAI